MRVRTRFATWLFGNPRRSIMPLINPKRLSQMIVFIEGAVGFIAQEALSKIEMGKSD